MQVNSIQASPNFNGIKFKSVSDLNLLDGFMKNNRLNPRFREICLEQLNNPININIEAGKNIKRLIFKVGEKVFKSNFFSNNIETLELAAAYANRLNPNKCKIVEYIA